MIRKYHQNDIETVLAIWLDTSIQAHHFIDAEFWKSQIENMRTIYIPASENFVIEHASKVVGFYSLHENMLAAIFVTPAFQGSGFGKQLITHAKQQRAALTLSVYKENKASLEFYHSQGFTIVSEQIDAHTGQLAYTMSSN